MTSGLRSPRPPRNDLLNNGFAAPNTYRQRALAVVSGPALTEGRASPTCRCRSVADRNGELPETVTHRGDVAVTGQALLAASALVLMSAHRSERLDAEPTMVCLVLGTTGCSRSSKRLGGRADTSGHWRTLDGHG
jgi:hypothetical protein